jgi:hypothetical protein
MRGLRRLVKRCAGRCVLMIERERRGGRPAGDSPAFREPFVRGWCRWCSAIGRFGLCWGRWTALLRHASARMRPRYTHCPVVARLQERCRDADFIAERAPFGGRFAGATSAAMRALPTAAKAITFHLIWRDASRLGSHVMNKPGIFVRSRLKRGKIELDTKRRCESPMNSWRSCQQTRALRLESRLSGRKAARLVPNDAVSSQIMRDCSERILGWIKHLRWPPRRLRESSTRAGISSKHVRGLSLQAKISSQRMREPPKQMRGSSVQTFFSSLRT